MIEAIGIRHMGQGEKGISFVQAQHVAGNVYCVLDNDVEEREGCELEFNPGNLVVVMEDRDADGQPFLMAMRLRGLP